MCAEFVDVTIDLQDLYKGKLQSADNKKGNEMKSVSVLNNGVIIYLKQMIRGLALVTLMRPDDTDIESRLTVMDYNVDIFKKGLEKIWEKSKLITDSDDNTKNIHSGNQVTVSNASATY